MGAALSGEEKERYLVGVGAHLYEAMLSADALPDVGVDRDLLDNATLASSSALQDSFKRLKKHMDTRAPAYLKDLLGKLAAFTDEPRLTGLLFLVISVAMETFYASSRRPPPGPNAEDRMSELQSLIEEYLKRYKMYLSDAEKLRDDTRRLEAQLSYLLTQTKNDMLKQGQTNSRLLKHWVNGAAFHVQMLIHLARLDQQGAEPVRVALASYGQDVRELLPRYRQYKAATIGISKRGEGQSEDVGVPDGRAAGFIIHDRELGKTADVTLQEDEVPTCPTVTTASCAQAYLDHLFSHHAPITQMEGYFSQMAENLDTLLAEGGGVLPPGVGSQPTPTCSKESVAGSRP